MVFLKRMEYYSSPTYIATEGYCTLQILCRKDTAKFFSLVNTQHTSSMQRAFTSEGSQGSILRSNAGTGGSS